MAAPASPGPARYRQDIAARSTISPTVRSSSGQAGTARSPRRSPGKRAPWS